MPVVWRRRVVWGWRRCASNSHPPCGRLQALAGHLRDTQVSRQRPTYSPPFIIPPPLQGRAYPDANPHLSEQRPSRVMGTVGDCWVGQFIKIWINTLAGSLPPLAGAHDPFKRIGRRVACGKWGSAGPKILSGRPVNVVRSPSTLEALLQRVMKAIFQGLSKVNRRRVGKSGRGGTRGEEIK